MITFRDKSGPAACPGAGNYTVGLTGKTLTFTAEELKKNFPQVEVAAVAYCSGNKCDRVGSLADRINA